MTNNTRPMSAAQDSSAVPMWRTALTLLVHAKERLEDASDADKPSAQMEYDAALAAYLAVADDLLIPSRPS